MRVVLRELLALGMGRTACIPTRLIWSRRRPRGRPICIQRKGSRDDTPARFVGGVGFRDPLIERARERRDCQSVDVEVAPGIALSEAERERKSHAVAHHIKSLIGVTCSVSVKAEGEVPRSQGKAVRVVDKRSKPN